MWGYMSGFLGICLFIQVQPFIGNYGHFAVSVGGMCM